MCRKGISEFGQIEKSISISINNLHYLNIIYQINNSLQISHILYI